MKKILFLILILLNIYSSQSIEDFKSLLIRNEDIINEGMKFGNRKKALKTLQEKNEIAKDLLLDLESENYMLREEVLALREAIEDIRNREVLCTVKIFGHEFFGISHDMKIIAGKVFL
jgi:hypothetical protein